MKRKATNHKETTNILLADDSNLTLRTLTKLLELSNNINIVGVCTDGFGVIPFLNKHSVDIIIMDVNLKVINGLEVTKMVKEQFPDVKIIGFSCYDDKMHKNFMLNNGASAFISKYDVSLQKLITKIEQLQLSNVA